ncbi:MAG: hypothetical protein J6Q81_02505, partial [Lentisphaeria bacterium]|nr:hypothetical protein [Lentisphaeria bacterium]
HGKNIAYLVIFTNFTRTIKRIYYALTTCNYGCRSDLYKLFADFFISEFAKSLNDAILIEHETWWL